MPKEMFFGFLTTLTDARQARYGTGQVDYLRLVAPQGEQALMPNEAYEFYTEAQRTVAPGWKNQVTTESMEKFSAYDPTAPIDLISPTPLLMIPAQDDQIIPLALVKAAYERAQQPKDMLVLPCQHTDVYKTEPWASQAAEAAVAWFSTHLAR
jgi:fermentation-respiration switch protein FrsA (DUF1100 family)